MTASLNGLDVLVFFAGAGENQSLLRELTCKGLSYLGLKIDKAKNDRVTNNLIKIVNQRNIGVVGLAVMCANLALNIESRGFAIAP